MEVPLGRTWSYRQSGTHCEEQLQSPRVAQGHSLEEGRHHDGSPRVQAVAAGEAAPGRTVESDAGVEDGVAAFAQASVEEASAQAAFERVAFEQAAFEVASAEEASGRVALELVAFALALGAAHYSQGVEPRVPYGLQGLTVDHCASRM